MSVENKSVIDFISEEDDKVVLTISDHLEWEMDNEHLYLLQEKINAYLMAIESGQVEKKYPASIGKKLYVRVACKYEPDENGRRFLSYVEKVLSESGYGFGYYCLN